jgi:hypothetical protein
LLLRVMIVWLAWLALVAVLLNSLLCGLSLLLLILFLSVWYRLLASAGDALLLFSTLGVSGGDALLLFCTFVASAGVALLTRTHPVAGSQAATCAC